MLSLENNHIFTLQCILSLSIQERFCISCPFNLFVKDVFYAHFLFYSLILTTMSPLVDQVLFLLPLQRF